MSILEQMKDRPSRFQTLLEKWKASKGDPIAGQQMLAGRMDPKFEQMTMTRKNPRLTSIMGDANPLGGDENKLLRQYYRMTKQGVE